MNTSSLFRCAGFVAGSAILLTGVSARAAAAAGDAMPEFQSYIKISGQAADISGSKASQAARTQEPKSGAGIEELYYSKELSKTTNMVIEGKALSGAEDYLASYKITKAEVGTFDVGYKRFRTFYDGVGGFFPLNNAWFPLKTQELHTDRGQFWAEAKITLPKMPVFTLRYTNELRNGRKDSTIWGDTSFTGIPNNVSPFSPVRKIIPATIQLGERHEEIEASVKHTLGNTTYQLTLLGDRVNNLDTRYMTRFPGEARLFPAPAATVLVPAANMNSQIIMEQTDGMEATMSVLNASTITVLSPRLTLRTGLSYSLLHSDSTGDRPIWTSTPTAVVVVIAPSNNNQNLLIGSRLEVWTAKAGVDLKPTKDFSATVAVRAEDKYVSSAGSLTSVAAAVNTANGAITITPTNQLNWSRVKEQSATPVVEARYTGIPDLTLYGNGSKRLLDGDERYSTPYNPLTAVNGTLANNDIGEDHANCAFGANWRQSSRLTFRSEVFLKDHEFLSEGYATRVGDHFMLRTKYSGLKFSAVAKLSPEVTCTSRYIYQTGRVDVTGVLPGAEEYDSMHAKNHTLSETVDWAPSRQFYLQGNVNVVFNVISTVYPRAGVAPATATAVAWDVNQVLQNANNNYITAGLTAGAVLSKEDDLKIQFTYYRADNSDAALALRTQPYGSDLKEYMVTAGLKHKFSDKWIGHAKLGYLDNKNTATGGRTSFRGPLGYVSIEYGL
ncbi:MAG: hypothetical protein HZC55_17580 [Verrucomicrobia bacterium]|nr:hypothetical protein [Verrucomicrobiota bacterium]